MSNPKLRILSKFRLDEVSICDRPAQEGARVAILKRAAPLRKDMVQPVLTTSDDGHSHLLDAAQAAGHTTWDNDHTHPWAKGPSGEVTIGATNGHSHGVAVLKESGRDGAHQGAPAESEPGHEAGGQTNTEQSMTTQDPKAAELEAVQKRATELEAELAIAKAWGALNDEERKHANSLPAADREAFLKSDDGTRRRAIEKAREADSVVYTSDAGEAFRKSDDPRLVRMARQADEANRLAKAEREARESERLSKRAGDELTSYPGEQQSKVALLKAVESLPEAQRAQVAALLKAGNDALKMGFEKRGVSGTNPEGSPEARYEALAKKYSADHKVDLVQARSLVLDTPEGAAVAQELS